MKAPFIEPYPFGKRFAVTLTDDTDRSTLSRIAPVYHCLAQHGVRSTKTVWPIRPSSISGKYATITTEGETLESLPYRRFCQELQSRGFEIAMHTASGGNSTREETIQAYDLFEEIFGHPPFTNIMHARNLENIYWGKEWVPNNYVLSTLISLVEPLEFLGHKVGSDYYWGDICRERTRYVRHFESLQPNTIAFDPATPYHDPAKPDVNWWFSCSYGSGTRLFDLLSPRNLSKLAEERGASIVHLYTWVYTLRSSPGNYQVHPRFEALMQMLAKYSDGWYIPAVELLDRLRAVRQLRIVIAGEYINIYNGSEMDLENLALNAPDWGMVLRCEGDQSLVRNEFGQINLGTIKSRQTATFKSNSSITMIATPTEQKPNYPKLLAGYGWRVLWQILHGRRGRTSEVNDPPWVSALWEEPRWMHG